MDKTVDRISVLPPDIIHHIMSYLSAKQVAQIGILSKTWNQLRISFPIFDFDQSYFFTRDESRKIKSMFDETRLKLRNRLHEFMEFVDDSLLRFCELKFSMDKFRLFMSILDDEESAPYIDKWVGLAIEKEVKEFDLNFLTGTYTLPQTIFYARSVTILKLVCCRLENISDIIRFNALRKLTLENVFLDEEMVQKLSSECPLLEEMFILECWGFQRLCVSKALKLKIMSVGSHELESVEVVAPNLQELVLKFSEEITPRVIDIIGCSQLKRLKFIGIGLTDQELHHFISNFPLLEDLILEYCRGPERITISSNQLKKFQVSSCRNMKALDLDTPNLLSVIFEDSPISTRINASCPWQVKYLSYFTFDTQWCLKLREFLRLSNQIETLSISASPNVRYLKLKEFRKNCPSLPCNVGNLMLCTKLSASEYMTLLDGLLWICYPKTLSLQMYPFKAHQKLIESFYNEVKNRDVSSLSCCNYQDIKCWRHYLKDIKVEGFVDLIDNKSIDADNLTKLLSTDNLGDGWSILPLGIIKLQLDWCFPVSTEKA